MGRLRTLSGREVCKLLAEHSFQQVRQRGPVKNPADSRRGESTAIPFPTMDAPPLIQDRLPGLLALCERHGVARLWAFGSAVASAGDPRPFDISRSDVDFLVEFRPLPVGSLADAYFGLREDLAAIFGRRVDLVTVGSLVNPYFRASVERTRVPLYAAA